jgi:hypothetical protein
MNDTTWNDSRFGPGSYEHASQEDRSTPRVRVHLAASVRPSGVRGFQTIVRDLSLAGFTAVSPARLEAHNFCWLSIPGFEAIQGEVVWWETGMFGVAFGKLLDQATFNAIIAYQRSGSGADDPVT